MAYMSDFNKDIDNSIELTAAKDELATNGNETAKVGTDDESNGNCTANQINTQDTNNVSVRDRLRGKRMTKESKENALNMKFWIPNLIAQGHHIVLYGAAGSGKTTVVLYMCLLILSEHEDAEVYYLYADGQIAMAARFENYCEGQGFSERYNILTEGLVEENLGLIEELVRSNEARAKNIIVVIDTLKYLNPNINNKDSNVKAMQRIKQLTNKGVTVISLHHTNKDGENYSGTADIEQDSDALFKIVTAPGDDPKNKISTIEEGGRVRYFMEPRSYSFTQGDPSSVKELESVINPQQLLQQNQDAYAISVIKATLNVEGEMTKTDLEKILNDDDGFDYSEKERKRILKQYKDKHWKVKKGGDKNRKHFYSSIDNTAEVIDSINEKIAVR